MKRIDIGLENASRRKYWQTVKNYNVTLRLLKAKNIHFSYRMPFGGMEDINQYFLSSVQFTPAK
jgi:hypothetical protein